jgi:hypothetical protein
LRTHEDEFLLTDTLGVTDTVDSAFTLGTIRTNTDEHKMLNATINILANNNANNIPETNLFRILLLVLLNKIRFRFSLASYRKKFYL